LVHWVVLPGRLSEADQRAEHTSVLRTVYLFLTLAVAVIGSLFGLSQLLYYAVGRLLGVDHPGGVGGDLLQAAAGPVSIALVYGAAWRYAAVLTRPQTPAEQTLGEAPRPAGIRRLYTYLVTLVSLVVLAIGVAGLLWTLGDVVLLALAVTTGDAWREQVALYATFAIVGLPVWLLHWRPSPTSPAEARSLARRLYGYLSLIGAMLALVGSAAAVLYKLLGLALGGTFSVGLGADLLHALAIASVAAVVAAYHWRVVRADVRVGQADPFEARATPDATAGPASIVVEIQAADSAALARAMATLRSTGVQVSVVATGAGP
jgi:hypothetical protein